MKWSRQLCKWKRCWSNLTRRLLKNCKELSKPSKSNSTTLKEAPRLGNAKPNTSSVCVPRLTRLTGNCVTVKPFGKGSTEKWTIGKLRLPPVLQLLPVWLWLVALPWMPMPKWTLKWQMSVSLQVWLPNRWHSWTKSFKRLILVLLVRILIGSRKKPVASVKPHKKMCLGSWKRPTK